MNPGEVIIFAFVGIWGTVAILIWVALARNPSRRIRMGIKDDAHAFLHAMTWPFKLFAVPFRWAHSVLWVPDSDGDDELEEPKEKKKLYR